MHDHAVVGEIHVVDPSADEGNQDRLGARGPFDGEQGSGVLDAGATVGSSGKLDVDDAADALEAVKEIALQQIAYVVGVVLEFGERIGAKEELPAGEMVSQPLSFRTTRPAFLPVGNQCSSR